IKAAYDSVDRRILWRQLQYMGINYDLIVNLRALFDCNNVLLMINNHISDPIDCKRGLFQGSAISPTLFNLYINSLIKQLKTYPMMTTHNVRTKCLFFA